MNSWINRGELFKLLIIISLHLLIPAYTMAKYGMSMCVLGMSEEFKPLSIAVNALWPRTGELNKLSLGSVISKSC